MKKGSTLPFVQKSLGSQWHKMYITMKKILFTMFLLLGMAQVSNAQSGETDYSVISKFLNAVVAQDVEVLTDVLHPDSYDEIDKLIGQSEVLGFRKWEIVGKRYYEDGTPSYIVAMGFENKNYEGLDQAYLSPSGHIFLYECFTVVTLGDSKCIVTNADPLSVSRVEGFLRKNGKMLPNKYYETYNEYGK